MKPKLIWLKRNLTSLLCLTLTLVAIPRVSIARPRPPQPPWPSAYLTIFGWDAPYWTAMVEPMAINEHLAANRLLKKSHAILNTTS
jgi:hypothetical protein